MGLDVGRAGRGGRALVAATLVAACLTGFQGAAAAEEASQASSGPDAGGGAAACAGLRPAPAGSPLDPAATTAQADPAPAAQAEGDGAPAEAAAPGGALDEQGGEAAATEAAPSPSAGAAADEPADASGQPASPAAPEAAEPAEGEGGGLSAASDSAEAAPDVTGAAADALPAADAPATGDASAAADPALPVPDAAASGDASAAEASDASDPALPAAEAAAAPAAGWLSLAGGARGYRDALGSKVTGSVFVDGAWRWFDPKTGVEARSATRQGRLYGKDGALVTGESSGRYYAPSTGAAAKSEFVEVAPGDVRRYGADGAAQTGAQWVDGAWRGFDSDGTMMTGLSDVGSRAYLYDAAGALQTGEIYAAGHWRYFDPGDGHMLGASECVQRVLARAYAHLGESEQDAWNLLWDAHVNYGAEWCEYGPCTATVWHFFAEAGMPHFFTGDLVPGWPHLAYDWLAARGRITWTPRVGEIVFVNYPGSFAADLGLSASHCEIISSVNADGSVSSIGALVGGIQEKVLYMQYVVGYGVPEFYLY